MVFATHVSGGGTGSPISGILRRAATWSTVAPKSMLGESRITERPGRPESSNSPAYSYARAVEQRRIFRPRPGYGWLSHASRLALDFVGSRMGMIRQ